MCALTPSGLKENLVQLTQGCRKLQPWAEISQRLRRYVLGSNNIYTDASIIVVMKIKVIVHPAEEGGFWAEVPGIPGCATQGETIEELLQNIHEAVEGCLSVDVSQA